MSRRLFVLAISRRKHVTAIHKANSFHMTDGLFLEAVRHVANPVSMILSVAMLVQWLGDTHRVNSMVQAGAAMQAAVDRVLANPATRTADLGGALGCRAMGQAVARALVAT